MSGDVCNDKAFRLALRFAPNGLIVWLIGLALIGGEFLLSYRPPPRLDIPYLIRSGIDLIETYPFFLAPFLLFSVVAFFALRDPNKRDQRTTLRIAFIIVAAAATIIFIPFNLGLAMWFAGG